jgi:hypothetical protein
VAERCFAGAIGALQGNHDGALRPPPGEAGQVQWLQGLAMSFSFLLDKFKVH